MILLYVCIESFVGPIFLKISSTPKEGLDTCHLLIIENNESNELKEIYDN